jgi:hypothetical protein
MLSAVSLKSVPREHILAAWNELAPIIERAVVIQGNEDILDVLGHILTGHYQCVVVVKDEKPIAVGITQITTYRGGKTGIIVYVAGEGLTEWVKFVDVITDWCKACGCNRVEGIGRIGWEKVLAEKGFLRIATTIRKQL